MSLTRHYAIDSAKQETGVPFTDLPENDDGTQPVIFLSRLSFNNDKYRKAVDATHVQVRAKQSAKIAVPDDELKAAALHAFAQGIVTGWQHIKAGDVWGEEGERHPSYSKAQLVGDVFNFDPMADEPFSVKAVIALLTPLPELHIDLINFATDRDNYKAARLEEDAKN